MKMRDTLKESMNINRIFIQLASLNRHLASFKLKM